MILAIETATNVCSVAFEDDKGRVFERRTEERGTHSEQLFLFIEELMQEHSFGMADLEAVLASEGPGSYTGLRIGASAIKGLLFQRHISFYGINTLASFAMQAGRRSELSDEQEAGKSCTIHSIIDARRKHFYYQPFEYDNKKLTASGEVQVIPIKEFESLVNKGDMIIGTGLDRMDRQILKEAEVMGEESITAVSLIAIYRNQQHFLEETDPETFSPKYYSSNQVS